MTGSLPYIAGGVLLIVAAAATWFMWPQIVKMLIAWGSAAMWKAAKAFIKADQLTPEQLKVKNSCLRAGMKYDAKRNRCVEPK